MTTDSPTGTDLVFAQASLRDRMEWARAIAAAGDLIPAGLRNRDGSPNPAKILLVAETGSMLQIHPVAAINGVHVIEGKPTLSAGLMSGLVRRAGHKLRVTTKGDVAAGTYEATAVLIRADDPTFEYRATWNAERAKRAGLLGKGTWSKYFEALAKARAISEVVREGAEDVLMGAAYTPEEMGAVVTEEGEVIREDLIEDAEIVTDEPKPTKGVPSTGVGSHETIAGVNAPDPRGDVQTWIDEIAATPTEDDLRHLHNEAAAKGVLDTIVRHGRGVHETLEDTFRTRLDELRAQANEPAPAEMSDYPEELPF